LIAGDLELLSMEIDPISLPVGRDHFPHACLEGGDGGFGQADGLCDGIRVHGEDSRHGSAPGKGLCSALRDWYNALSSRGYRETPRLLPFGVRGVLLLEAF